MGYPKLTPAERLAHLPPLVPADCCQPLPATWATAPLRALSLSSLGGQPFYLLETDDGKRLTLDANSGQPVEGVDAQVALANAQQYNGQVTWIYAGALWEDPWTLSRALDADRPLHQVRAEDEQGTWLYLSNRTGEVVRDVTRHERLWNWLGAWLHWLYPLRDGFGFDNGWRVLVISVSLAASAMTFLGMLVGWLRVRWRHRYRSGSCSPYLRASWARWHHLLGLSCGVILLLWVVSGLFSMRPWGLTDRQSELVLRSADIRFSDFPLSPKAVLSQLAKSDFIAVELRWLRLADQHYVLALNAQGDSRIVQAKQPLLAAFSESQLRNAIRAVGPHQTFQAQWLTAYDRYYFARAEQSMYGGVSRPLPVLRVRFNDEAQTWGYLDPASGEWVAQQDGSQRTGRWLFNALHSWDWPWLLRYSRLREALLIGLSIGCTVIAVSGMVLGYRRLKRKRSTPRTRA